MRIFSIERVITSLGIFPIRRRRAFAKGPLNIPNFTRAGFIIRKGRIVMFARWGRSFLIKGSLKERESLTFEFTNVRSVLDVSGNRNAQGQNIGPSVWIRGNI